MIFNVTIFSIPTFLVPIRIVHAEIIVEQEGQVELSHTEPHEENKPEFYFQTSSMQGNVGEHIVMNFYSDQEISEARIFLPENSSIVEEELDNRINLSETEQVGEWIVQVTHPQNTFAIPLNFKVAGNYEINVEEAVILFEISEKDSGSNDKSVDHEEEQEIPIDTQEENSVIDTEDTRIEGRSSVTVSNWEQFVSAWNNNSVTEIRQTSTATINTGNQTLNVRENSITLSGIRLSSNLSPVSLRVSGAADLVMIDSNFSDSNVSNFEVPVIEHLGTGAIRATNFGTRTQRRARVNIRGRNIFLSGQLLLFNDNSGDSASIEVLDGTLVIGGQNLLPFLNSQINSSPSASIPPIITTENSIVHFRNFTRVNMRSSADSLIQVPGVGPSGSSMAASWSEPLTAKITGKNASKVLDSTIESFSTVYPIVVTEMASSYRILTFGTENSPSVGTVTVNHVNEQGEMLSESESLVGDVGSIYQVEPKQIEGYSLFEQPTNEVGRFIEGNIDVTFVYEKEKQVGTVTVLYLDTEENEVATPIELVGEIGSEYKTEEKEIPNFRLLEIPDNAEGSFTEDNILVKYIYEKLGTTNPLDPLEPEIEVDPENKPILPENQGLFSIDFVSQFNFGMQSISVKDRNYYALPQRLLDEDGTVNETEERPNYVQITDNRKNGDRSGWSLSATLDEEGFTNENNENLRGAQINLENQELITSSANENSEKPGIVSPDVTLRPGVKQTLLEANSNEGRGTWIYRFGDRETAGRSVSLDVPKKSNPSAEKYQTTIKWELSTVPGNEID